ALVDDGMTEETLGMTQQFLKNYTINWGNTITRRLAYAMDDRFYGLRDGYLAAIQPGLAALDLANVNETIQENLQYDNMYIVFITRDAEALKAKLLSGDATHITYAGEKSAEHMAEDEEIANFPIPVQADKFTIININDVYETGGALQ
ncbi:MAG TPA: hypothetical protein VLC48_03930, partial [Gemmatimonadota bacterium]|nr:hypothetical protein [Gemmatimonadota bacterium]